MQYYAMYQVMIYGAELSNLTVKLAHRLHVTQRTMARDMFRNSLMDEIRNEIELAMTWSHML